MITALQNQFNVDLFLCRIDIKKRLIAKSYCFRHTKRLQYNRDKC